MLIDCNSSDTCIRVHDDLEAAHASISQKVFIANVRLIKAMCAVFMHRHSMFVVSICLFEQPNREEKYLHCKRACCTWSVAPIKT